MGAIRQFRNEWKYPCSTDDLSIIRSRLEAVMHKDAHSGPDGRYEIHSLYFDDYKDTCAKENEAGVSERFKYRIRYYGAQPDMIKLEYKQKINGRCHKESCPISLQEYQEMTAGNIDLVLWRAHEPLLERFCVRCLTRDFVPRAIVDYERTAYIEENAHIRITLDENISVSDDISHFLDGDYIRYPLQERQQQVLEVKFDHILPGYIKHLATHRNMIRTSFSKYGLGRKMLQDMRS